jgi:hypothetical protein
MEKTLFCILIIQALQLATLANENTQNKDWWWLVQLGKCYHRYAFTVFFIGLIKNCFFL